ncbi:MAG: hypothetical protein NZ951_08205 [Dehalococcoidia bacterium]|nr:hypothetical protein [Dehalococcoidia bacterium]MDW8120429.1 hypothetical protein [Chloroflexota bacterium]
MNPQEKPPARSSEPLFQIDFQWFEKQRIVPSAFLLPRLCADCRREMEGRLDKGLGVPWQEYMERIAQHCSREPGFITEGTPLLEGVFRLLLGARNEPVGLTALKDALEEWWQTGHSVRVVSAEVLMRVLQRSGAYGIRQVSPP